MLLRRDVNTHLYQLQMSANRLCKLPLFLSLKKIPLAKLMEPNFDFEYSSKTQF